MVEQAITPSVDIVQSFAVDTAGNVLYTYWQLSGSGGARIAKAGGGLLIFPFIPRLFFTAPDGELYAQSNDSSTLQIQKVTIGSSSLSLTNFGGRYNIGCVPIGRDAAWLCHGDRVQVISDYSYEVWNAAGTTRVIDLPVLKAPVRKMVAASASYCFVATRNAGLVRVNPVNDDTMTIFDSCYDVFAMGALPNDHLLFHGLDLSSGSLVSGLVDETGAYEILSTLGDREIREIVQIY
jgi:hypothetical protein